ncbi:MAG: KH domain-containing protein [Candidatus Woesearchaeota archaeon]
MTEQSPPNEVPEEEIRFDIRIPKSRIAVLIGQSGETKKTIESEAYCRLEIDSHEGDVQIFGTDGLKCYVAKDIIRAIGRGFNPEIALTLIKSENSLEVIDLSEGFKSKNQMLRVKGRVIGSKGKTRSVIEKTLQVQVSVFGKTISVIGEVERVLCAKQAIEMIIDGSPHSSVYRWLEKKEKSFAQLEVLGSSNPLKEEFQKYAD